ncbi:MAG TPA: alpha/beta fold hydrolase [Methylomirabilota bacterium]|nr:alpha/beta fold hydrolase [Methylomirabilota bacterium]
MIFHTLDGSGDPLLLLNGIAMTAASWQPVARPLAERFTVVRCDLRGQLMSPGRPPADVGDHIGDVVELLDHVGLESVHVLATSFGGAVGALLAARAPERVRSLMSVASADGFTESMADEVARWRDATVRSLEGPDRGVLSDVLEPVVYSPAYVEAHRDERALRRRQIAALPDAWFDGLVGLLDSAESFSLSSELAAIRCPVLVVAAELDAFIPLERCRALAETIPNAEFRVIEGAGHAVVVEQPATVADLALEFFLRASP